MSARAALKDAVRDEGIVSRHVPVLTREIADMLVRRPAGVFLDLTLGGGGHARSFLPLLPADNPYVGLDRDPSALGVARRALAEYGTRVNYVNGNFAWADTIFADYAGRVTNILIDLGLSTDQLADARRGFSFLVDGPLDMRFDRKSGATAASVVNTLSAEALADIFFRLGGEGFSRKIARAIVDARPTRPIETTGELARLVARAVSGRRRHPATKVFQALRIYVNDELSALEVALPAAVKLLAPGGRLFIISYHSLEDRIVKGFFRSASADGAVKALFKGVIRPSAPEVRENPAARSARLRAVERT